MDDILVRLLALLAGVVLVGAVATDAVSTLVTTQRRSGRWWPTYVFTGGPGGCGGRWPGTSAPSTPVSGS